MIEWLEDTQEMEGRTIELVRESQSLWDGLVIKFTDGAAIRITSCDGDYGVCASDPEIEDRVTAGEITEKEYRAKERARAEASKKRADDERRLLYMALKREFEDD